MLRKIGYEVKAISQLPQRNFLGLKQSLDIETIIDAGANLGQFGEWMRNEFPDSTIHSFEPIKTTFDQLQGKTNRDPKWQSYNLALSDTVCDREINFYVDHSSSSSFLEATPNEAILYPETKAKIKQVVRCTTLDQWVVDEKLDLKHDILIKMDVQGHEDSVIKGATKILSRAKAVIAEANIENLLESQTSFAELVRLLAASEFHFIGVLEHGFLKDGRVASLDAVFTKH